jgi:hypothetical protein
MPNKRSSLLAGRNSAPLKPEEVPRATNVLLGLDDKVNTRHDPNSRTEFKVSVDSLGNTYDEIVFGPDIYPGSSVVDPNSALGLEAAAAHELTHFHRWTNKTAISEEHLEHVDEALASLQAILRYDHQLNRTDVRLLISDAMQRLHLYIKELNTSSA